ncbi:MAG: 50S ribosomal protein L10 [Chitinophagaceae bacterium]
MNKTQKTEAIELLKTKFTQYNHFYLTDSSSLSVEQINHLRRVCFSKKVEMKVAKNTLIKKALESLNKENIAGLYEALHGSTAILFAENAKDPAMILSSFRKANNQERPVLKAAFINSEVFSGDHQLVALTKLKSKEELIGEIIGLLLSPVQRVVSALKNRPAAAGEVVES